MKKVFKNLKQRVCDSYRIFFICEWSGECSEPINFSVAKDWVVTVAPLILKCLSVCLQMATQGILNLRLAEFLPEFDQENLQEYIADATSELTDLLRTENANKKDLVEQDVVTDKMRSFIEEKAYDSIGWQKDFVRLFSKKNGTYHWVKSNYQQEAMEALAAAPA